MSDEKLDTHGCVAPPWTATPRRAKVASMGEGPYRSGVPRPPTPTPIMTPATIPRWLDGYRARDPHVAAVVDLAVRAGWTEAEMMRQLVVVLANTKSDVERRLAAHLARSSVPMWAALDDDAEAGEGGSDG